MSVLHAYDLAATRDASQQNTTTENVPPVSPSRLALTPRLASLRQTLLGVCSRLSLSSTGDDMIQAMLRDPITAVHVPDRVEEILERSLHHG